MRLRAPLICFALAVGCSAAVTDRPTEGQVQSAHHPFFVRMGVPCPEGMNEYPDMCWACPLEDPAQCKLKCESGNAGACSVLGLQYDVGWGDWPKDPLLAQTNYKKACSGGSLYGCANVAICLEKGDVCPKDLARAAAMFTDLCERGFLGSCIAIARIRFGAGSGAEGFKYAERACKGRRNPPDCRFLGRACLDHPEVAPPNCVEDARKLACEYGDARACAGQFPAEPEDARSGE